MQSYRKIDDRVQDFSKRVQRLRLFERSSKLDPIHLSEFEEALDFLMTRKEYALDQELWKELYKRSLYFYQFPARIGTIPIGMVCKHNEVVTFYVRYESNDTILHFDTHSDLNPVKGSAHLMPLYQQWRQTQQSSVLEQIQSIVWDIGAAQSGPMMTMGAKNIVWCLPSWVPDRQVTIPFWLRTSRNQQDIVLSSDADLSAHHLEFVRAKRKPSDEVRHYAKIQTGRPGKTMLERLEEMIDATYILDIDLDYFVCNGESYDKSYEEEPYDLQSHDRTEMIVFNQRSPRDRNVKSKELLDYKKRLHREVLKINQRIRLFLKLIRDLKKRGHVPSLISMCDSSNVAFENCRHCNSDGNGYVPTHLALYVHTMLVRGLEKLFS